MNYFRLVICKFGECISCKRFDHGKRHYVLLPFFCCNSYGIVWESQSKQGNYKQLCRCVWKTLGNEDFKGMTTCKQCFSWNDSGMTELVSEIFWHVHRYFFCLFSGPGFGLYLLATKPSMNTTFLGILITRLDNITCVIKCKNIKRMGSFRAMLSAMSVHVVMQRSDATINLNMFNHVLRI